MPSKCWSMAVPKQGEEREHRGEQGKGAYCMSNGLQKVGNTTVL